MRDSSGLAVVGASVRIRHAATGVERMVGTNERGDFVFSSLQPGGYALSVSQDGFKSVERTGIELTASDVLNVGALTLELGAVTETVTVYATGAAVQTVSSERSGVVTSDQVSNLLIRNRTVFSLMQTLPGVVDQGGAESIDRTWNMAVNGGRRNTVGVALDGATLNAIGNNFNAVIGVSQDAVAEVKVLLSNYQAEYGRMSGANVSLITKSGTRAFHGLASFFKRHEQFNANDFFNNRLGQPKAPYRYNTPNYNIGGPVYIPGHFNRNRDKLFFFFSQEYWPIRSTSGLNQLTVPTELERAGDFSQSVELSGKLIVITDPTARSPFPGNRVPPSRIDRNGQALLNFLPPPNYFDRTVSAGRYNYVTETDNENPQRMETLKIDYNAGPKDMLMMNFSDYSDKEVGAVGAATAGSVKWPQFRKTTTHNGWLALVRHTRIWSPTVVNEFNASYSTRPEIGSYEQDELKRNQRSTIGFDVPQFNPASNPLNVVPNATFGGVTTPANIIIEGRFPLRTTHQVLTLTDNITWSYSGHTFKAGYYLDHFWRNAAETVTFNGNFDFGRNVNNPLDTGYAFANAAVGVFNAYTEVSSRPFLHYRLTTMEWFAQDNWKVTRKLALDCGVRFSWFPPAYERDNFASGFVPSRYSMAERVQLIAPAMVNGRRAGVSPVDGQVYAVTLIGAIAPGRGNSANGMVVPTPGNSYPRALIDDRGIHYSPRFGFAYDPFGKGKTAIRGGIGLFYNRENLGATLSNFGFQTPLVQTPIINFGTLSTLRSSTGLLFPGNVLGIERAGKMPTVANYSLTIQHNLGSGVILDVGYVGALGRHLMWARNLNAIPFGTNFDPKNADSTNRGVVMPSAFLRPMVGYGDIGYREWGSTSNYHSLQTSVSRRFSHGVQFGGSWTWSKAMGYNNNDTDNVSSLVPVRVWNYGMLSYDRTHVLKLNWLWDVPKSPWKIVPAKAVLNDWHISGLASFVSGAPLGVGFNTTSAIDITGSPTDNARIYVTGNPVLPKSERSTSRSFRTEVFQLPAKGTIGNAASTLIRGPGINNWEIGIFKSFPLRETMKFQFRWELYNAFNHTQFSGIDNTARFDSVTGEQVNARFGEYNASRNPRIMQFALRFLF